MPPVAPPNALALLLGMAVFVASSGVQAQDPAFLRTEAAANTHTLEIRDGHLHLDGEQLPENAVPAGLDLDGLAFVMQYSGSVAPVLTLRGVAYVLDGARLIRFDEIEQAGDAAQVYGLGQPADARAVPLRSQAAPQPVVTSEQAYLMRLSEHDRRLYDLLQQERAMEAEAQALAVRVRRTADPTRRDSLVSDLRARIDAIFALKQEVRRAEIEQASAQLDAVRARLDERATRRDAIVQERLRSLLGDLAD
ncbi:MAG: hypothetical protein AAF089_08150 [Bacteroidota bacterium]